MNYLTLGLIRHSTPGRGQMRGLGRLGIGRYAFPQSVTRANPWGAYFGVGVEVPFAKHVLIAGGAEIDVFHGPEDGPLRSYLASPVSARIGIRFKY